MKKLRVALLLNIIILQIGCSKSDIIVPSPVPEPNQSPSNFEISIEELYDFRVTFYWSESIDPEKDIVSYSIYLDNELVKDSISQRWFEINNLSELTTYKLSVIAKDLNGNTTNSSKSFTTPKYYLRYSKFYDYAKVDFDGGGGRPYSMIRTISGEYVISGKSSRLGGVGLQLFTMKIDEEGNEIWKYFYDYEIGDSMYFNITQLNDQNFIIGAGNDILKIDNDGGLIWHKEISGYTDGFNASINSIKEDLNGNLFLVGARTSDNSSKDLVGTLTKLNEVGEVKWDKEFYLLGHDLFNDLVITDDNKIIILGTAGTGSHTSYSDIWIVHLDNSGDKIWEKTYGNHKWDYPYQIIKMKDGNYAFCGVGINISASSDAILYKIDPNGNEIWNNVNSIGYYTNFSLTETKSGGIATTGYDYGEDRNSLILLNYDQSGNVIWSHFFDKLGVDSSGHGILQMYDEGFLIVGGNDSTNIFGQDNIWVIKTDPEGYFGEY